MLNIRVNVRTGGWEVLDKMVHNRNEYIYIYIYTHTHICICLGVPENMCETGEKSNKISFYKFI